MTKSIYVGNLSYKVTSDMLKKVFEKYGEVVSSKIVSDFDGRSKGFGFVEMADENQAKSAIDALNGTELNGRDMTVNLAKPKSDAPRSNNNSFSRNNDRGSSNSNNNRW